MILIISITISQGALGYEGVFRKSCEHTMKVMRSQKESLLR